MRFAPLSRLLSFCSSRNAIITPKLAVAPLVVIVCLLASSNGSRAQNIGYAGMQTSVAVTGLSTPIGMVLDAAGNKYIVDSGLSSIVVLSPSGAQTSITPSIALSGPTAIAIDHAGNLYVANGTGNQDILKIPAGSTTATALATGVAGITGLAVDSTGAVYYATNSTSVYKIPSGGGSAAAITTTPVIFLNAYALAIDAFDNLYVTDTNYKNLSEIPKTGTPSNLEQNNLDPDPDALAVDKAGNLFVASHSANTVVMYTGSTGIRVLGASLQGPSALAADRFGNLYAATSTTVGLDMIAYDAVDFGSANVCPTGGSQTAPCTQTATLRFNIAADATRSISDVAIHVTTQGVSNLDFTATSDTCSGQTFASYTTCQVVITFQPGAAGLRLGAIDLSDTQHTQCNTTPVLNTIYLHGVGVAPIGVFDAAPISTLTTGFPSGAYPSSLATDAAGNLYAVENNSCNIYKYGPLPTRTPSLLVGNGTCTAVTNVPGPASAATLYSVYRMAVSGRGDLYLSADYAVLKIDAVTQAISVFAGTPHTQGHSVDGTLGPNALFSYISGLAVDTSGSVYISDDQYGIVQKIDGATGVVTTVAGVYNSYGFTADGGAATSALLNGPVAIALDASGNLYIAEHYNDVVRKVSAGDGTITTFAGTAPAAYTGTSTRTTKGHSGDGGQANAALLNDPEGLAFDAAGDLYIADSSNYVVRKVSAATGIISPVAGLFNVGGNEVYTGDGGPATLAGFSYIQDIALDTAGNLYIADGDNTVVRSVFAASAKAGFGSFSVDTSSPAIDVTLSDIGNAPLVLTAVTPSTNFNLAGADTTCTSSTSVQPGGACVLGIEFLPTTASGSPLTGMITLTGNTGNLPGSSQTVATSGTGTAQVATELALSGVPTGIFVNGTLGTVTVNVEDVAGVIVTGSTASVTLTITGPGGYSQTVTVAAVAGVAIIDLSSYHLSPAGTYTVTAASGSLTPPTPATVSVQLPVTNMALVGLPTTSVSPGNLGTLTVKLEDTNNAVSTAANGPVTITITGPGGYSQAVTAQAVNGVATFDLSAYPLATPGAYTATVTRTGLPTLSPTFTVTPLASQVVVSPLPATVPNGGTLGSVTATLEDANGNIATASSALVTATITGPGGYSQAVTGTSVNGVATLNLAGLPPFTAPGTYTVTTTSPNLPPSSPPSPSPSWRPRSSSARTRQRYR